MLVAPPPSSSSPASHSAMSASPTTLEDILDLAQFDFGPSPSSDSRSSSHSPSASTNPLPPTPPQPTPPASFSTIESDLFYNTYLAGLSGKPGLAPPNTDLGAFNYADLFASYAAGSSIQAIQEPMKPASNQLPDIFSGLFQSSSSAGTTPSSVNTQHHHHQPLAIDPQLVASPTAPSPATSFPLHSVTEDEEAEDEDEDDEDDHEDAIAVILKVAKNKPTRKPAVVSGGIVKKTTAAVKESKDSDDWRPSPEEYKKLSSKEKRQLRNKISARNFRVRRKEYITTLESHIADRDNLIDAIRSELGASRTENYELRREVDALKRALTDGRTTVDSLALPPPAALEVDENMNVTVRKPVAAPAASSLNTANTRKDLPNSPLSANSRSFWGGAASLGGGVTPVHTTLIPDLPFPSSPFASLAATLAGKSTSRASVLSALENINPDLNCAPPPPPPTEKPTLPLSTNGVFDAFVDPQQLTIKSFDPYRMQLWQNVARQGAFLRAQQPQPSQQPFQQQQQQQQFAPAQPVYSPLTNGLKPQFFTESTSKIPSSSKSQPAVGLFGLLSGKSSTGLTTPTPSPSPIAMALPTSSEKQVNPQAAVMAAIASQTLLSRMTSAFWDAFSGTPPPSLPANRGSASDARNWDVEKVRRVLEGKAVVRVVDVEQEKSSSEDPTAALEEKMKSLSVQSREAERPSSTTTSTSLFKGLLGQ